MGISWLNSLYKAMAASATSSEEVFLVLFFWQFREWLARLCQPYRIINFTDFLLELDGLSPVSWAVMLEVHPFGM
jgi:hypothetical protein